jgi:hypothetical protein
MGSNSLNLQQGAFTNLSAQTILAALVAAGFGTSGKIYYVDAVNGNDVNNGTAPLSVSPGVGAFQTLAQGYAALNSGENDVLVMIGSGTTAGSQRLTATFTWAKNAAHLVGICSGSQFSQRSRIAPAIAPAATAFTPLFTVSGNGCYFANIEFFHGFNTGTTAQICMNITGSRNVFNNCQLSGMGDAASAADAGSRSIVITSGENYFKHCVIGLDTVARSALNSSVEIQSAAPRNVFEDCVFPAIASAASTTLMFLAAAAASIGTMTIFKRCLFYNCSTFNGGAAVAGLFKLVASAGGAILLQDCTEYGYTDWGYDAASKAQILVSGPVPTSSTSGIAVVNT